MSVFRPGGEFVASFGDRVNTPYGIAIDDDGFLYICSNNKDSCCTLSHYFRYYCIVIIISTIYCTILNLLLKKWSTQYYSKIIIQCVT